MQGAARRRPPWLTLVVAAALLPGCRPAPQEGVGRVRPPIPAPDPGLVPVPRPAAEDLEGAARDAIGQREERLERALADPAAPKVDRAAAYGELGKSYHAFGLHRFAIPCYENAARLDPAAFAWPYLLARANWYLGQAEATAKALERALALDPRSLPALMLLADTHRKAERIAESRAGYERVLEVSPGQAAALYGLGQLDVLTGDAPAAIRHLEAALAAQPQASRIHYQLALAYRQVGNAGKARWHMERRGEGAPNPVPDPLMEGLLDLNPQFVARRGVAALSAGAFGRAVELLRTAREGMPEDADLRIQLGVALAGSGDPEAALAEYREALRLRPNEPRALYFSGQALSLLGRDQEALTAMRRAVQVHPAYAEAQLGLAQALRRVGRHGEALSPLEEAARLDPSNLQARLERAQLLARLGRCRDAVEAGEAGLRAYARDPRLTVILARLLAACPDPAVRDPGRALVLARQAFAANGTFENAATVALVHATRGEWTEAAAWQRRALALVPEGRAPARAALGERLAAYRERRMPEVEW
jgi:tetratricopeptide (TPR) repeat protein